MEQIVNVGAVTQFYMYPCHRSKYACRKLSHPINLLRRKEDLSKEIITAKTWGVTSHAHPWVLQWPP